MAKRPVFLPSARPQQLVVEEMISFTWHPGMAESQKKKNVAALHDSALEKGLGPLLEVSTKSTDWIGRQLSAFNLELPLDDGRLIPLECAFQGSKVFEPGGPYQDLYWGSSREAKRDSRLRSSGDLVGFRLEEQEFPTVPKTAFYDWLYLRSVSHATEFLSQVQSYAGFTDIEFNPKRSINCQARSCALAVSLIRRKQLTSFSRYPRRLFEAIAQQEAINPGLTDDQLRLL